MVSSSRVCLGCGRAITKADPLQKRPAETSSRSYFQELAAWLYEREKFDEAFRAYSRAAERAPSREVWMGLGNVSVVLKRWADAEKAYKELLHIDPTNDESRYALAQVLIARNRYTEAIEQLEQTARDTSDPMTSLACRMTMAACLAMQKKAVAAIGLLSALKREWPKEPRIAFSLAQIYYDLGQYEQATRECQYVLSLQPDHEGALRLMAEASMARSRVATEIPLGSIMFGAALGPAGALAGWLLLMPRREQKRKV